MLKIVVYDGPESIDRQTVEAIKKVSDELDVVAPNSDDELFEAIVDADVFFGFHGPELFHRAKRLRWIQTTSAGVDAVLDSALIERKIPISNASGVHAPQVAETAWALTLAIARGLPAYFKQQQEHRWQVQPHLDLEGSLAAVVGLGGIGRRYARIAAAMGMRVLAVDNQDPPKPDGVEAIWKTDGIDELVGLADVIMLSCPLTEETRHLIDAKRLSLMKSRAILINIARGGIIDENALCEALDNGQIAGAGIDVCEQEPLPQESPLWNTPNLIITPHTAGYAPSRCQRLATFFCENLQRFLADQPLVNRVDPAKGYPEPPKH